MVHLSIAMISVIMNLVFVILNEVKNLVLLNGKRFFADAQTPSLHCVRAQA